MRNKIAIFCNIIIFQSLLLQADPILVAVLMVKNEAPVMEKTLQPLIDAGITDYLIYDTGSTDDTMPITQDFFIKNNITNFVIKQGMWIDFASSRNQALQLAQQYFPEATFMLMLDAEWILHNGTDLLAFCHQCKNNPETLYYIRITGTHIDFNHARLIKAGSNITFVGKVHEVPNIPAQAKIPDHVYFQLSPTKYGQKKSEARWKKDRDLLLEEFNNDPTDPRTAYYLAQTYFCLQDWNNAIIWYEYRTTLSGHNEENFLTRLVLAQAYHLSGNTDKMIVNYLKAFELRPHRADPIIRLAQYYYSIQAYHLCYLFAKYAIGIPYPHTEILPVEKWLYDFVRFELLSLTAYMFGDIKLGKQATIQALQICPDVTYLQQNLKMYEKLVG